MKYSPPALTTKERAWAVTGISVALGGTLVLAAIWPERAQPAHGTKTLQEWLELRNSGNIRDLTDESQTAIRAMGTNALPYLVSMVSARDSSLRLKLRAWAGKNPSIRKWIRTSNGERLRGAAGLEALGPIAAPAIPELIPLLGDEQTAYPAALALGAIGEIAVPPLVQCLTNTNAWLRVSAVQAINFMHGAEGAIPSLVTCLTDPEPAVRSSAAIALGDMRKQPDTVVPRLIALLDDAESTVRQAGTIALGLYGSQARAAKEKLTRMQNDPSSEVRQAANSAMNKILPPKAEDATTD